MKKKTKFGNTESVLQFTLTLCTVMVCFVWWSTATGMKFGILLPEVVVVALVREASDPSIFLFFWGEVGTVRGWNGRKGGGREK